MNYLKTHYLLSMILLSGFSKGQNNVGINVQAPTQALSVDRGLNIDDNNQNNGISLLNGLRFGNTEANNQIVGITSNRTGVSPYSLDFYTSNSRRMIITQAGRVGIGIVPATYALEVNGTIQASNIRTHLNIFATGGIFSDDDIVAGIDLVVGSDVWAGANINAGNNIIADNNITASDGDIISENGELKAGGRGVVMSNSASRLKVLAYTIGFSANNLAPGNSLTSNINITGANFTATPTTYVGNVVTENGEYYRAMVVLENVSTTSFTVRVVNVHSNPISFSGAQWRILALGAY